MSLSGINIHILMSYLVLGLQITATPFNLDESAMTSYDFGEDDGIFDEKDEEFNIIHVDVHGGSFITPGYPDAHAPNVNLTWLLLAPPIGKIRLLVTELRLELTTGCTDDYVEIFDGGSIFSPRLARLCDRHSNLAYVSSGNEMLVMFISDQHYQDPGFQMEYMLETGNQCNTTLTASNGVITSPNYPSNYPDDTDCWTLIKLDDPKDEIIVTFSTLELEYTMDCEFDFVELFDGATKDAPVIGPFCHQSYEESFISKAGVFLIHFHSDYLVNNKGFVLSYTSVGEFEPTQNPEVEECNWKMNKLNGTISSPNYPDFYEPNQECIFLLEAPEDRKITLKMDKIVMDEHETCKFDYIEVRDGHSPTSPQLGKYCGRQNDVGHVVTSSGNTMWVKFVSDDEQQFPGFQARYMVVKEAPKQKECKGICDIPTEKPDTPLLITSQPQNISLSEGDSHMFTCSADNPKAKVKWMKDLIPLHYGEQEYFPGITILPNNSLLIKPMSWMLEGIYTCALLSNFDIKVINAWVKFSSKNEDSRCNIRFTVKPEAVNVIEGSHSFLRCSTELPAAIEWKKNNRSLTQDTQPRCRLILPGLLLLHPLQQEDTGLYSCVASTIGPQACARQVDTLVEVAPPPDAICGVPRLEAISRGKPRQLHGKIVGGNEAAKGSSPWQALLWEEQKGVFCGGSLIDRNWVVTAAHCLHMFEDLHHRKLELDNFYVKLGKHDTKQTEIHEQHFRIKEIIYHPQYDPKTYDNDVALLHLNNPAQFTDYILPICLGDYNLLQNHVYSKQVTGLVTGWGRQSEKGLAPRFLHEIVLPTVDQQTCIKSAENFLVSDNMFCAGYAQEMKGDACQGDSGGPFSVQVNHRWYLAGIVSWGEGCAREGKYGFYTRVGNHYQWIQDTISRK